ncbi:MAG: 4-(cytidine 5'-diphospho)-2-C-methyl-D-erythritol kinase [Pseudomonadota bacterium]
MTQLPPPAEISHPADAARLGPSQTFLARAKLNLYLHITGRREDGYHLLNSLVVFPEIGDLLTVRPATGLSLTAAGPFAGNMGPPEKNLALRAAQALWAQAQHLTTALAPAGRAHGSTAPAIGGAALHLEKRLPVAAGLGGGSADAAAALRALCTLWRVPIAADSLADLALGLGADVPVCLAGRSCIMRDIGETLDPAPLLPPFWVVLVNPGVAVSTAEVFVQFRQSSGKQSAPLPRPTGFRDLADLAQWLAGHSNDLERAAVGLAPAIGQALDALNAHAMLARMSGSGATCFGLFATQFQAEAAAASLARAHPGWWVAAAAVHEGERAV